MGAAVDLAARLGVVTRQENSKSRVTPKGTAPTDRVSTPGGVDHRVINSQGPSPKIVPIIMFGALAAGVILILANYIMPNGYLGMPNNLYLLGGLGLVLVGIVAATQYR